MPGYYDDSVASVTQISLWVMDFNQLAPAFAALERKVTILHGLEANVLPGTDIVGPEKFDISPSRG
jgi:hypothetical protein